MVLMLLEDTNNKDMPGRVGGRLGKYVEEDAAARKREQTPRGERFRARVGLDEATDKTA